MFLKTFKKVISAQAKHEETVRLIEQAFSEAEKSNAAFEARKQQILQEIKNGSRRSSGKLPV